MTDLALAAEKYGARTLEQIYNDMKCGCGHLGSFHTGNPEGGPTACNATAADLDPGDLLEPVDDPTLPCLCTEFGAVDD